MPPEISEEELTAFKAHKAENDALKLEIEKSKSKKPDDDEGDDKGKKSKKPDDDEGDDDEDLDVIVKRNRKAADGKKAETANLEGALKFNLGVSEFVKTNADLLPEDATQIVEAAEKQAYDSAPEKAGAIRTAIIKNFFEVQEHLDLLTPTQKKTVEDFLKLTSSGKQERSQNVFENIFEPSLEMMKRLRKAEELGKSRGGLVTGNKVEDGYKARLIQSSRKTYLGEKGEK